jgi:hypothetical protein
MNSARWPKQTDLDQGDLLALVYRPESFAF